MEILWALFWINVFVVPWKLVCDSTTYTQNDTVSANTPSSGIPFYVCGQFHGYIYL